MNVQNFKVITSKEPVTHNGVTLDLIPANETFAGTIYDDEDSYFLYHSHKVMSFRRGNAVDDRYIYVLERVNK